MPFNRFFAPLTPLFALALQAGLVKLIDRGSGRRRRIVAALLLVYIAAQPWLPKSGTLTESLIRIRGRFTPGEDERPDNRRMSKRLQWVDDSEEDWMKNAIDLGLWLKHNAPPDASIALGSVGIIPYYSELYTIDFFGLVTQSIAHSKARSGFQMPGHQKFDLEMVMDCQPTYIIFSGKYRDDWRVNPSYWAKSLGFTMHPEFNNYYEYIRVELDGSLFGLYRRRLLAKGENQSEQLSNEHYQPHGPGRLKDPHLQPVPLLRQSIRSL